ncbi:hypothetical protein [Planctobacterium marinum]|uniref:hypothetical protein n=1 Tax=Planctobacterium marinum TaxID=1631968 RepID=UPI0030C6C820
MSALLGLKVFYGLSFLATPMPNITALLYTISDNAAWTEPASFILSSLLAILALTLGIKGIIYNNVCIGEQCSLDY